MHSLWHQVIGFVFCCFGIIFAAKTIHYIKAGMGVQMIIGGFCTAIMFSYGASSFLRARKISRS